MISAYIMEKLLHEIYNTVEGYNNIEDKKDFNVAYSLCNEQKIDFYLKDQNAKNMLHYAISYNYLNTVKYLVEKCGLSIHDLDEDGKSTFHYVDSKEILDYLVLQGVQVNLCDKYGHVALYYVKLRGNDLVFKELLKLGSIINSSKDIISKYEKEVTEIVENADNIYLGYHVNILTLINIYDSNSKSSLNYQEVLSLISTRLKSLILRLGIIIV